MHRESELEMADEHAMRVAYVLTRSDSIGGVQIHIRDLCTALMAQGHEVCVFVGQDGPLLTMLRERNIPYRRIAALERAIHPLRDLRALMQLKSSIADFAPHLISTHSSKAGVLGRIVGKWLAIPTVFTAHGWAFADGVSKQKRRFYVPIERAMAVWADRVVTVCEMDRQLALAHRIAPHGKVVTVHNGMPDIEQHLLARPDVSPPRLIMVARFEEQKDHQLFIDVLSELTDYAWEVDFVGDGPLMSSMQDLVASYGMDARFHFHGSSRQVAELMAAAQAFVLISHWEGFPRSILEAMRSGLPVIASNVGGVCESVCEGESGYVVSRGDRAAVRERLVALLKNPSLRRRFGEAARARYEEQFRFEHMFRKTVNVYVDVLRERGVLPKRLLAI